MTTPLQQPLETALAYHARGWPVFPCRAGEEIDSYGEALAPKTPLTSNGLRGASKNERIIREWWARTPDAMIGVPTGSAIGAFVLDLDVKPGVGDGHDWLADMEAEHHPLPATARARTMGGGTHIFFAHVDGIRNRGGLGQCVDVRGEGGYIIAPGSVARDGNGYAWIDDSPIAEAPDWLLDLLLPPARPAQTYEYHYTPGGNDPYVERAVEDELRKVATTGKGSRGYQLNASAFSIGTLVGAGALSRGDAESRLFDAARACGVLAADGERQTWAKIRRGLDAGERQPRQIPEGQQQDNTRLVDISRMIANGLAKARGETPEKHAEKSAPNAESEKRIQTSDSTQAVSTTVEISPQAETEAPPAFHATPFSWIDPATLPRREFAYGTHYIRKYVSVTVSPGGLGKTSNSIAEALSMVSGKPLLGIKPPQRMRVWLFNAEDPRDEMDRRIMAAAIHYRLKPDDLEGIYLDTGREQELVVAIDDKRGVKIQVPVVEAVVEQIERHGIDCMVVDPFVSTHQVNENDNGAIDKVAKLWAQIADQTNCSIDVVHHLRKVSDREATVEDARGAVALIGAARSVRVLNRMSEEQATAASVAPEERFSYFHVHQGKANLTRMSAAQEWRKLESVPLGNGRGLSKPQDHAGVVTAWAWPNSEAVVSELTDEQRAQIKTLLDNGSYKAAPQGRPWAGEAIAYVLGIDAEDKASRARTGRVLKALIAEGVLAIVEDRDPQSRMVAKFVRSA
jgi:hypothetical protein